MLAKITPRDKNFFTPATPRPAGMPPAYLAAVILAAAGQIE